MQHLRTPSRLGRPLPRRLAALVAGLGAWATASALFEPPDGPATPPVGPAPAETAPAAAPPRKEKPPKRVVVRIDRDRETLGTVELEDDAVLVIRTYPNGAVQSFLKSRIAKVSPLVDPRPGQEGTVYLRNGQVAEGVIVEDGFEQVVVLVEGIRMRFLREQVEEVVLAPTFDEQYANFKASLGEQITVRHLALCKWLMDERRYDLAEAELERIVEAKPDLAEARQMLRIVEAQLAMQVSGAEADPSDGGFGVSAEDETRSGPVDMSDLLPTKLVSNEDVNIIRVFEIDFDDPPEMAVAPDTIRSFLEGYGSSNLLPRSAEGRTALFRAEPIEIVRLMFELKARELYPEIRVLTEPRSLNLFRQRVHNAWLVNSCATSRCHGGPYAGRLFLHRANLRDARVRCTNLLILERLKLDDQWPLINYDVPLDSLIIQHGLPRDVARRPHPDVKGWSPVFTRSNQRLLRYAAEWIESMMQPRPEYPVDYEPPRLGDVAQAPDDGRADR